MKIFITWSGSLSQDVAAALHQWLPTVIQALQPFYSSEEIRSGQRWFDAIGAGLQATAFGLAVITRENHQCAPWLHYEAGAIAREAEKARVAVFLVDLPREDFRGPLSHYQATRANDREQVLKLLLHINELTSAPVHEDRLRRQFDTYWSDLRSAIDAAIDKHGASAEGERQKDPTEQAIDRLALMIQDLSRQQSEFQQQLIDAVTPPLTIGLARGTGKSATLEALRLRDTIRAQMETGEPVIPPSEADPKNGKS